MLPIHASIVYPEPSAFRVWLEFKTEGGGAEEAEDYEKGITILMLHFASNTAHLHKEKWVSMRVFKGLDKV